METAETAAWWAEPRGASSATWIANYQRSLGGRQRVLLSELVEQLRPRSVLEVGCHCGPNLIRLARDHADVELYGIDVNPDAITAGRAWAESEGVTDRLTLTVGAIPGALRQLPSHEVDMVVTSYCLAYVSPRDVDDVLYELGRLAAHHVVVMEPLPTEDYQGRESPGGYQEWTHDYPSRQEWITTLRDWTMTTHVIDPPVDHLNGACVFSECSG